MKKYKRKLIIILPVLLILLFWIGMVSIDYICSKKAQPPIFAQRINSAMDADIYQGIGYRIVIDDGYAVAPPNSELKGYFYWGWR